ncbi:MAG: thioredoxin family protein [Bacteroidia bacterium]|nr:thioredoxin family protein [Bacteroidia bacterium]MDW8235381.1 thioredoxin family protein [Bacteroidia bacterium]
MGWSGWVFVWIQAALQWYISTQPSQPVKKGDVVYLRMWAVLKPGYHIYSSRPPSGPANTPTQLVIEKIQGLKPLPLTEEGKLQEMHDTIFDADVYFYEKEVTFIQPFVVTGSPATVSGFLRYQYCDEEQCYMQTYEVSASFEVKEEPAESPSVSAAEVRRTPPAAETNPKDCTSTSMPSPPLEKTTETPPSSATSVTSASIAPSNSSLTTIGWTFIKAFLFGLAAILTPCTFPMIPLTVSYFTKAAEKRSGRWLATWYGASILIIFWVLGLLLTMLFGAGATYNLATNPWLNLIFFLLLLIFGLSFLGLFELTLPASWGTATSRFASPHSLGGIFFMALTLVLASFSCIGPLVGTLMIDMVGGKIWEPLVGMTGFGLAFALPFSLLAGMPKLLQRLPRSGEWMETFKVTLGFLELALALKFLSNADLVWHLGILDREVYLSLWIALLLFLSLYLLGKVPLKGNAPQEIGVLRLLASMGSFALAIYLFTGLWGAPLKMFSGLLPPVHEEMGVRVLGGTSSGHSQPTCAYPSHRKYADALRKYTPLDLCAFYDLEEARQYAAQVQKPLLIDFTGHTCTNCRQVESSVWSHPAVKKHLQQDFVLVSLFVDDGTPLDTPLVVEGKKLRTVGDRWLYLEQSLYKMQAQPYYVIVGENLEPLVPPMGFTLDAEAYLSFLREGLEKFKQQKSQPHI